MPIVILYVWSGVQPTWTRITRTGKSTTKLTGKLESAIALEQEIWYERDREKPSSFTLFSCVLLYENKKALRSINLQGYSKSSFINCHYFREGTAAITFSVQYIHAKDFNNSPTKN